MTSSTVLLAGGYAEDGSMSRLTKKYSLKPQGGGGGGQFDVHNSGLMRHARKYHSCGHFVSKDGYNAGYVVGGVGLDDLTQDEVELKSVEVYYTDIGEWVYIQDLPTTRFHASSFVLGGRLWLLGGQSSGIKQDLAVIHNHETGWHLANFRLGRGQYSHVSFAINQDQPHAILRKQYSRTWVSA